MSRRILAHFHLLLGDEHVHLFRVACMAWVIFVGGEADNMATGDSNERDE